MLKVTLFSALAAALIGLICGWHSWRSAARDQEIPTWSRITSGLGLFAITAQVLLLATIYAGSIIPFDLFERWWFQGQFILFLMAVILITTEESTSKWWLFASSTYFLVFGFLILLDA